MTSSNPTLDFHSGSGPQDSRRQSRHFGQAMSQDRNREIIDTMKALRTARSINPALHGANELPRFGDLSACQISDVDEERLWTLEADRLVDSLTTDHAPLDTGASSPFRYGISRLSFAQLETMADKLLCALAVCGLDDQAVLLRFDSSERSVNAAILTQSHRKLATRLTAEETIQKVQRTRDYKSSHVPTEHPLHVVAADNPDKPVTAVTDADAPGYYLLVDYLTATLARLLAVGFESRPSFWHHMALTALAKLSVKVKVLSHNLPALALQAMRRPSITLRLAVEASRAGGYVDEAPKSSRFQDPYVAAYMSDMSAVSTWLLRMLWHAVADLETRNTRGRATDEFDISVTVYGTGPRLHPTMVYQDRRGHVSGSPSSAAVGLCHRALDILTDTAASIRGARTPPATGQMRGQNGRDMSCPNLFVATGRIASDLTLDLRSMAELISVMVPLSFMNPAVAEGISKACRAVNASGTVQLLHNKSRAFAAFASLHSVAVPLHGYSRSRDRPMPHSRSLSRSFLAQPRYRAATGLSQAAGQTGWWRWSLDALRESPVYTSRTRRRMVLQQAQSWAIEETAITVSCLGYTLGVLAGCAVLVLGGLLAGFLIGSRIDGVDPFNLTIFSWVVAGFIVLVAKSVRVADWPWRDFFKGRVMCRSVRELAGVTGLDDQAIIMHLLSLESETPLLTKGPYNGAFLFADSDGFSIDVPPKVGTLVVSGIIILEVLTESGPALVCLDLRAQVGRFQRIDSENLRCLVHSQDTETQRLACVSHFGDDDENRALDFRWQMIRWEKIIGLYEDEGRAVI